MRKHIALILSTAILSASPTIAMAPHIKYCIAVFKEENRKRISFFLPQKDLHQAGELGQQQVVQRCTSGQLGGGHNGHCKCPRTVQWSWWTPVRSWPVHEPRDAGGVLQSGHLNWCALLCEPYICSYKCSKLTSSVAHRSQFLLVETAFQSLWIAPCRGWLCVRKPNTNFNFWILNNMVIPLVQLRKNCCATTAYPSLE